MMTKDKKIEFMGWKKNSLLVFVGWAALCFAGRLSAQSKVNVTVDASKTGITLGPFVMGIHTSVYDAVLLSPKLPELLHNDGIYVLRYPGGGYSDMYHWSTNTLNNWKATGNKGYLAPGADYGNFLKLVDKVGTAVITVNYGANTQGTGPGEPAEAAAWVAYSNGNPGDTHVIGKDSTGVDWKTTGYWATMRASVPLAQDDGYNFLRIAHPRPFYIRYWEIGNELFGDGYYGRYGGGIEEDLHVGYNKDESQDPKFRMNNAKLSPTTYGKGVVEFSKAMKAVDPKIFVGAVLVTPPADYTWAPDWNKDVLTASWQDIDFAIVHWYTGNLLPPDWKNLDSANLLQAPSQELPRMVGELLESFKKYAGGKSLQLAVTEINSRPGAKVLDLNTLGLYAADAYAALAQDGTVNIDWLELHTDAFLDPKDDTPHPAYYGLQMFHRLIQIGDSFISCSSDGSLVDAYASQHKDGSVAVMLINRSLDHAANVNVRLNGAAVASEGIRYDWGKSDPGQGPFVHQSKADNLGPSFSVTVPAYTVTDVVIPKQTTK